MEVVKVLVNAGGFEWRRTVGDHAQLYYEHPTNEDDRRHVTVPLHDELRIGTLRDIAVPVRTISSRSVSGSIETPEQRCKPG